MISQAPYTAIKLKQLIENEIPVGEHGGTLLIGLVAFQSDCVLLRDRTMKSALHYCVENSNPASAELVLAAAPELLDAPDQEGFTPLHLAVIAGNLSLVRFLLHKRADLTAVDNEKHSVVHWATGRNSNNYKVIYDNKRKRKKYRSKINFCQ